MLFKLQDMVWQLIPVFTGVIFPLLNLSTLSQTAQKHWLRRIFQNPQMTFSRVEAVNSLKADEWKMFDLEMIWICFIFSFLSVFRFRAIIGINAPSWLIVQSVVKHFLKMPPVRCLLFAFVFLSCKVVLQYSYLFNPLIPRMSYLIQFSWVFF